jgi:hypothetical protein
MANGTPVVFLAFANDPDAHLENLKTESRRVYRTLQPLEDKGQIQVHREESSNIDELYQDLLRHDGRIVIFHYGGHANGKALRLEGGDGDGKGLAGLLGQQSGLKLVFLNGCASKGHVKHLLDAGVPAVIATSVPIGDVKAQEFANAFYLALAEGRSIAAAFDSSSAFVQGKYGAGGEGVVFTRSGTDWEDEDEEYDVPVLEWGLYMQESCADDLEQWRLPQALSAWEVILTDRDGPLRALDGKPFLLKYQAPSRTLSARVCANCGATAIEPKETTTCVICASSDIQTVSVSTQVAGQLVPFSVSEDEARKHALEYAGDESEIVQMNRVFVPYWIFDLATHTRFAAERGINRDLTAIPPKLEWEPVKDEIDLAFDGFLVSASSVPVGRGSTAQNWYWELDQAEPLQRLDTGTVSIPLDVSMQSAFDKIAAEQQRKLEDEITARVGGNQQRNRSTDNRYRKVAARTILLPHWYATAKVEKGQAGLLVNGQTGAVRPLYLPGTVNLNNGSPTSMTKRNYESTDNPAQTSLVASVFAGMGIGLMVGLLLGLANPPPGGGQPTVAIFIGAVGAALAVLLGLNDRHFSTAKGLRIGAFGLAVIFAAPIGIYVRAHELLAPVLPSAPTLVERKAELIELGYEKTEALKILRAQIQKPKESAGGVGSNSTASRASRSGLHSTPTSDGTCDHLTKSDKEWKKGDFKSNDVISSISGIISNADKSKWTPLLKAVQSESWKPLPNAVNGESMDHSQKNLLFIARDASCAAGNFEGHKISTPDKLCQSSAGAEGQPGANLVGVLPADDKKRVLERVNNDISLTQQKKALRLLGEFLCR